MRSYIPDYELRAPGDLAEALHVLADAPGEWRPLAGGTDLMMLLQAGKLDCRSFLSIWHLHVLRGISISKFSVIMGALTTYTEILHHPLLRSEFPLLTAAAMETGSIAIQNRGTLGGNIVNASPAADTPPALLVYNAEIELTSVRGSRWLPYHRFHTGYKEMSLLADELLTRIKLPRDRSRSYARYRKVGTRNAQAISKLCFAGLRNLDTGEVRIAFGSAAPVPLRCFQTEEAIQSGHDFARALSAELKPIDDMRSTAAYRLRVAQNLLAEFVTHER